MKKIILALGLLVVIAIGIAVYYIFSNLDALVKAAIEEYGSRATHTAVRVDKVHIELKDGAGSIQGLTIANPGGFAAPYAFSLGEVSTRIDIKSLKQEPYIIDEVSIRAPQVFMEINQDKKANLNELKNNLAVATPSTQAKPATTETGTAKEPRLIIRRVLFAEGNIQARVVPLNNKEYQLKLPTLDMHNLGGKNGATPTQIAREILNRLTDQARDEIRKKGLDQELDKLKARAREKLDAEKARLEEKAEAEKAKLQQQSAAEKARLQTDANNKLEAEKQKAADKLKGLFGR